MIRVVLYIRVSTEEQALHGDSLEAQERALVEYANSQGYKIIKIYKDEGHSARQPALKRDKMQELLTDAQEDMFDLIIFTKLDRWFRSVQEYYKVQEVLDRHKVDWKTILESYDTTTADGRLKINIMLSVAENESDRTSERIRFVNEMKVQKKEPVTGAQPFGYKIATVNGERRIIKDPETEDYINDMFDHFMTYKSVYGTSIYLNEKYNMERTRIATTNALKNPAYTGEYRGVSDYRPAYITHDQHNEIMRIFNDHVNTKKPKKNHIYLFTGLMRCPVCGSSMTSRIKSPWGRSKKYYYSYHCRKNQEKRCPNSKRAHEITVEKWLLANIKQKLDAYETDIKLRESAPQLQPKKDLRKYEDRLKRLNNMYMMGNIEDVEYMEMTRELKQKIAEIKSEESPEVKKKDIEQLKSVITGDFEQLYETLTRKNKRALWTSIIKEIKVEDGKPVDIIFL